MAVQLPDESLRINLIADRCHSICASISKRPPTPIHRDFYHDQIMFANGRTYLVDLDLVSLGHPALDVGNFLAHLTEDGIRRFDDPMHWRDEEAQIMEHYVALLPDVSKRDIAAFKAISLARHISISWKIRGRRKSTSSIIQEVDALTNTVLLNFDLVSGS
jgi:streptomycin 6-kinase